LLPGDLQNGAGETGGIVFARLPTAQSATNSANSDNLGFYFNDTYKPLPNLTLGLGIRFDREQISSQGYTFFDPVVESRQYDNLLNLSGAESNGSDVNNDGITTYGLEVGDPLYAGSGVTPNDPLRVSNLARELRFAAGGRLTRHNVESEIESTFISNSDILAYGHPRTAEDMDITNNNLAPRISVSWDPWADGKSKATAAWGRFYDKLFLQVVVQEEGPDFINQYYRLDIDGVDAEGLPDNFVGRPISKAPPNALQVDRNLKTPYSDEFTIGFSREIAPEMSVSINYIQRKFKDQLQDVDVNHTARKPGANGASCPPDRVTVSGYCDTFGATAQAPPTGSGGEAGSGRSDERRGDTYPDLYINNLNFNQILRVGNYNVQDYNAIELQFVRRLSRKWQMDASYVFSKATGQADSFNSESGNDIALTELRDGYLEYDQTHVAKFYATAYLPADWRVGGGITWASGLPYSMTNRFTASDNVDYTQARRLYGHRDPNLGYFYDEDRNMHRNPSVYEVNVRTEKNFVMGKVSAGAFFEIFNLLNTDDLRVFEIDDRATSGQAVEQRDFGRRFQFGIKMNF
jgi:hypothetical protein